MPAPAQIKELVERFKFNIDDYKKGNYNETQVRREFIDPFFHALGWDVSNEKGYAEAYKDVIHEFSLKTKDKAEAPDYLFRIGGTKKFFVEAKKPSVNLKDDISPAFQLRRYAWSAKLPLSILTDFEELAVYDCRIQPKKNDKSSTGRINYYTYDQYIEKWDEIESIFSREAILKGSFDKFAESNKGKRGTAEVDDAFLKEIEKWRELLARNIALRNESLTNRELNFAVQKTIDRIIFLRICEDRGIEDYGQLMNLQNGANVYQRMLQIFTRADEKYNSGLFHFEDEKNRNEDPDKITPALTIDDDKLKEIIKNLYYPDSPYEFSVLPSDILGHVYEQFLGKVIRLTKGHQAKIEEKPEVKKAGGVYYTPTYIVDYIVKNTLGKKLEEIEKKCNIAEPALSGVEESGGKTKREIPAQSRNDINKAIKEASKIKVLDPACGSGSFLIGAYQYLLDWHIKIYTSELPPLDKGRAGVGSPVYQTKENDYRLTTAEKKRILLNNIYGVDIDSQAVEVTKLSLLLKVLEGETDESLNTQLSMFRERALPDLSNNIKCGNSLIGPDFYNQTELTLDEEENYRINVFDWNDEFKEIMGDDSAPSGDEGFDVVIGNPPYVNITNYPMQKIYLSKTYKTFAGNSDLYVFFVEKSSMLLKTKGIFGMILSNKWIRADYGKALRSQLSNSVSIEEIIDFGELPVFKGVGTFPLILIFQNKFNASFKTKFTQINKLPPEKGITSQCKESGFDISVSTFINDHWIIVKSDESELYKKAFSSGTPIGELFNEKIRRGVVTGFNEAFIIDEKIRDRLISEHKTSSEIIFPFVSGNETRRYRINFRNRYLIFTQRGIEIKKYPAIEAYLKQFIEDLKPKKHRNETRGRKPGKYQWYEIQDSTKYFDDFKLPKIVYGQFQIAPHFCFSSNPLTFGSNHYMIVSEDERLLKYVLGILNSKFYFFIMKNLTGVLGDANNKGRLISQKSAFERFPINTIDFSAPIFNDMISKVNLISNNHMSLENSKTPQEKKNIERQIAAADKQIDQLVYKLYDLTEDEIKIVEESIK